MSNQQWGKNPPRTIRLSHQAQQIIDTACGEYPRFEDHWRGIEWLLARTPEKGEPKNPSNPNEDLLFVSSGIDDANTKDVWIFYSYDAEYVDIIGVKIP